MASVPKSGFEPKVGDHVVLLCQTDDRPIWTTGTIRSEHPFAVEVEARWERPLQAHSNIVLIHDCGRNIAKAEASIQGTFRTGNRSTITFEDFRWDIAESRDHQRYKVEAQAVVRSTSDSGTGVEMEDQLATTLNMSVGGTLIKVGKPIQIGELVEFRMALDHGRSIRALGIVAHSNENGTTVGLNFIDYVGSSLSELKQFLNRIAA